MFNKKIKWFFIDPDLSIILVTDIGEVYNWSDITCSNPHVNYYSQMIDLRNTCFVLTAAGGNSTFIALTDDGRVYYFQTYDNYDCFGWMRQMNLKKKIICLSCGDGFFVVVTEDNKVYTWGQNNHGQLGISTCTEDFTMKLHEVKFIGSKIVKVACGQAHTLALTETRKLFVWGGNTYGELGFNNRKNSLSPVMVEINSNRMKILDITAMKNMSAVIGDDGLTHIWGSCFEQQISKPIALEYTNLFDVCNALCARPPTSVRNLNASEETKILKDLEAAFNDRETSDLTIKVEERDIYVHKAILQLRSSYFKNLFQSMSSEDDQNVIKLKTFSYSLYYAYFKYMYFGVIDVSLEEKFDLLKLADTHGEKKFKKSCFQTMRKETTVANVISIYKMAKEYNLEELEEHCFDFYADNAKYVMKTKSFAELDADTKNIFITKADEAGVFNM